MLRQGIEISPDSLPSKIGMRCGARRCGRHMGRARRLSPELLATIPWSGVLFEPVRLLEDGRTVTCSGFAYMPEPKLNSCAVTIDAPGLSSPIIVSSFRTCEVTQTTVSGLKRAQIKFEFSCPQCNARHSLQNVTLTRLVVEAAMRGNTKFVTIP